MKHAKLIVGISAAATVALLLAGGWHMSGRFAAARDKLAARDTEFKKLQLLYASKPFPNADNALLARQDTASLDTMRTALTNALAAANLPEPQLSRSLFIQALQSSLRNKLQGAAPIVEGARVVPDNFGFGFDRYRGADAIMPAEGVVTRLAQQLIIVEKLVAEVYAAEVSSLRAIKRHDFDVAPGGAEAPAPDDDGRRRDRRARVAAAAPADGLRRTDLYTAQHFTLEVTGRQGAISELLNRFAAMELFVVVTEVELRKRADDVKPPPVPVVAAAAPAAPAPAAAVTAPAPAAAPVVSALPPSQRQLSGHEIDPPIDARIELDVYNFNPKGA
jgi:hypothetical protein